MNINQNTKVTISAGTLVAGLAYIAIWGFNNVATKSDIEDLNVLIKVQYVELRLSTENDKLRIYEDMQTAGSSLTDAEQAKYEHLLESIAALNTERNKLLGLTDYAILPTNN